MTSTCDPYVVIEKQTFNKGGVQNYVIYKDIKTGKRWEVIGACQQIGKCWEGAVDPKPELDCPIGWAYRQDCCKFEINILDNGD